MKKWKFGTVLTVVMMTLLLSSAGGSFAATHTQPGAGPMKPELAAKKEMIRKQHEQRVSPAKRKVAIDSAAGAERTGVERGPQNQSARRYYRRRTAAHSGASLRYYQQSAPA